MDTETKDRLKELNAVLQTKRAKIAEHRDAIQVDGENVKVAPEAVASLRQTVGEAEEIKTLIVDLEKAEGIGRWQDEPAGGGAAGEDMAAEQRARLHSAAALQRKSIGEMFAESDALKQYNEDGRPKSGSRALELKTANIGRFWLPRGEMEAKAALELLEYKDVFTAAGGTFTSPAFGSQENLGLVIPAYRTQRVRDLFPTQRTTANMIEYIRRTGYTNNARTVAERTAADGSVATGAPTDVFGLKPPSNLVFTTETAPIRTIAHTIDVSKTVLDDTPRLQDTINGEMLYGLRLAEDAELLFGDGTGTHLLGVCNQPGIQLYDGASGPATDYKADEIRRSLTLVMLAYYESTGVVMHPFDWEETELAKDNQNRYVIVTNIQVGAEQTIWRNRVVTTPAMTQGTWLAGAFGLGVQLFDREEANIAISTETRDLFERNAICIRAEERVGLASPRPESMVRGTFK